MLAALTLTDYGILVAIIAAVVGILVHYLRAIREDQAAFRAEFSERHRGLEHRVFTVEERVQGIENKKVSHEDWIRVVASNQNRLERMSKSIAELTGKLDATIGITGSLNRIGDALRHRAEAKP